MELKLKSISKSGIPQALKKAEGYRYLNEPEETESICRDILSVEPDHQEALRLLGLAIADQFCGFSPGRCEEAERVFQRLADPYERLYYRGILRERKAKARLRAGQPPDELVPLLEDAMNCFEQSASIHPAGDEDAILRWNRCLRLLQSLPRPEHEKEVIEIDTTEGVPVA